jgi:hypothetical protein
MLTGTHTQERIINLMEKGAKLVFHTAMGPESCPFLWRVTLLHNGKEIILSNAPTYSPFDEDPKDSECDVAKAIIKRPDVRDCYSGWQSDYARTYRTTYEHINQPTPRWITEQWATPVSMYDL